MSSKNKNTFMKTLKAPSENKKIEDENWSISDDDSDNENLAPSFLKKSKNLDLKIIDQYVPQPAPRKSLTNERMPWEKSNQSMSPKSDKSVNSYKFNQNKHGSTKNSDDSLNLDNLKNKNKNDHRKSIGSNINDEDQFQRSNRTEEFRRSLSKSPHSRKNSPYHEIIKKDNINGGRNSSLRNDQIYGSDDDGDSYLQKRKMSSNDKLSRSGNSTPDSEFQKKTKIKYDDYDDKKNVNSRTASRKSSIAENMEGRKSTDLNSSHLTNNKYNHASSRSTKDGKMKDSLLKDSSDYRHKDNNHSRKSSVSNKSNNNSDDENNRIRKKSDSSIAKIQIYSDDSCNDLEHSSKTMSLYSKKEKEQVMQKDKKKKSEKKENKLSEIFSKNSILSNERKNSLRKNSFGELKKSTKSEDSDGYVDGMYENKNKYKQESKNKILNNFDNDKSKRQNSLSKIKHNSSDEEDNDDSKKKQSDKQFSRKQMEEKILTDKKDEYLFRKMMENFETSDNRSQVDEKSKDDFDDKTSVCDVVLNDNSKTGNKSTTKEIDKIKINERASKQKLNEAINQLNFNENKKNTSNERKKMSTNNVLKAKKFGLSREASSANFESTSDIRNVVFNEWLGIVDQRMKSAKKERQIMEKQLEEKKKKEREEKLVEAKSSYEAWVVSKKDNLNNKKIQQQKLEHKKKKTEEEKLSKKNDAERAFKDWKDKIDKELIKRKKKEEKKQREQEENKKHQELDKQKGSNDAFNKWNENKTNFLKSLLSEAAQKKMAQKEEEERIKQQKINNAKSKYEEWIENKEHMEELMKRQTLLKLHSDFSKKQPWKPNPLSLRTYAI